MVSEDRVIYVDTRYPIPSDVDGIVYVSPDEDEQEEDWQEVESELSLLTVAESDQVSEVVEPPILLGIEEQVVVYPLGGSASVNAILLIDEITTASEYEIRVVPR